MSKRTFKFRSEEWTNYLTFCDFFGVKPSNAKNIKLFVQLRKPKIVYN